MSFRTAEDPTLIYSKTAASPNLLGLSRHSHSIVSSHDNRLILNGNLVLLNTGTGRGAVKNLGF
ncbi:hypothetical protein [Mesorhizobium onobrychidis]|uniref:Uncharacterized protein n=1 Tax=Mesorhizobium onobrychidis TaxID=2775404 RepID=A0ABY5QV50_9HYPH|nr:hypothetical protein [Mesorhizobium onobrychidis]UVC15095.1 hypothetical protein IHQ72_31665 [Mesorhizobium onobrychidis]